MSLNQGEKEQDHWDIVIQSRTPLLHLQLGQVWRYRDLLFLLVRRDYVASFKQTILGPLWFFLQPLLTTFVYMFVFGRVAKIDTGGTPGMLFYFMNIILWNFFSSCLLSSSNTFLSNASLFGKVYFPRLIIPISTVFSNLLRFGVQLAMLIALIIYFQFAQPGSVNIQWQIVFFPLVLLLMAMMGLGLGMLISSMTTKYRDLTHLVTFGVQLFMYATPVVYPVSFLEGNVGDVLFLNPLSSIFEFYRYMILGVGVVSPNGLMYSAGVALALMAFGVIVFSKVEKRFIDTV